MSSFCLNSAWALIAEVKIPDGSSSPTGDNFTPSTLKIEEGTTVKWTNRDSTLHTVTSGTPEGDELSTVFDSGYLTAGKSFEYTFKKTGTFKYFCTLHPFKKGIIVVSNGVFPSQILSDPNEEAYRLYNEADDLIKTGKYAESVEKIEQSIKLWPFVPHAYTLKGIGLINQGKDNESLIPLKTAIDSYTNGTYRFQTYNGERSDEGIPFYWYASALFNLERYDESLQMYSKAIDAYERYIKALDSNPPFSSGRISNGILEEEFYRPDGTIGPKDDNFNKILEASKSEAFGRLSDAYYWKGYALHYMGLRDESLQYYHNATEINQNLEPYK